MHLYQPDHDLPATRVVFNTDAVAARIAPWFVGAGDVCVSITDIRYKPNTSCVVTYRVDAGDSRTFVHAKAFQLQDWPTRKQKIVQDDGAAGQSSDVLYDDDFCFALFRFPVDSKLPDISKFVEDPNEFLSRVLFEEFQAERLVSFETLAYKPNRRFTAALNLESGKRLVLKLHDPTTFEHVLESAAILKKTSPVATPKREGRSNRHRALAYEWVVGTRPSISRIDRGECKRLMEMIFEFLDCLHHPAPSSGKPVPVQRASDGITEIGDYLASVYPPIADNIREAGRRILNGLPSEVPATLIHGDFHLDQILVSRGKKGRVSACDFDSCCLGDPTIDLANFVGHLRYRACLGEVSLEQVSEINHWATRHLENSDDPASANRFAWNQLAAMFRLVTHPFRSGSANWIKQTEQFVAHINQQTDFISRTSKSIPIPLNMELSGNAELVLESGIDELKQNNTVQMDPAFAFLVDAFDPAVAADVLKQAMPCLEQEFGDFSIENILIRRHKIGRRCLIEYELATEQGPRFVLGKASAKRLDRKTFVRQSSLFDRRGFADDCIDGICVPRPLGVWKEWKMWFQEKVEAVDGMKILKENRLATVNDRIAAAMAKLHSSRYRRKHVHSVQDELDQLTDHLETMKTELPDDRKRITQITVSCVAIAKSISSHELRPIHRDFYHDQIMFSEDKTWLVDLDLVCMGHPALDVGNFVAHLTEDAIRRFDDAKHWRTEEQQLVDLYLAAMPSVTKTDIAAFTVISLARHIYLSWNIQGRRNWTGPVIDEVERLTKQFLIDSDAQNPNLILQSKD